MLLSTYVILCKGEIMPRGKSRNDASMLAMALVGYELEKKRIEERIREIRRKLGAGSKAAEPDGQPARRRRLSAAARRRIAVAQKKRWAEHRKAQAAKGA
jgi:hypothetical protein